MSELLNIRGECTCVYAIASDVNVLMCVHTCVLVLVYVLVRVRVCVHVDMRVYTFR